MPDGQMEGSEEGSGPTPSVGYRRYALGLLLVIYTLNFVDRQIVTILAEPIRNDLGLADWQLGLLTGLAFAIFYTVLGFPVARLAETGDRPLIISAAVALWSVFTGVCGFAHSFTHLVLARIGVGVGEAGCTPTAVSLIADFTPRDKRAGAMAIYTTGSSIGSFLGMAIGGFVAAQWGWRSAFLLVGAPGIAIALLSMATLAEPRRARPARCATRAERPSFRATLSEVLQRRAFRLTVAGAVTQSFLGYGFGAFLGSFLLRNHATELAAFSASFGMKPIGIVGLALGISTGLAGIAGAMSGGLAADHFGRRDIRAYGRVPAVGVLIAAPCYAMAVLSPTITPALVFLCFATLFGSLWYGPCYAIIQGTAAPQNRATATAMLLFCSNLFGLGLGPLTLGLMSDAFASSLGPAEGMRWAMLLCSFAGLAAGCCFWSASRTVADDMRH